MNVMREIQRINERELALGLSDTASWHHEFRHSAYVFLGGIDSSLSEGDLLAIFSQVGEIVDLLLVRDKSTGNSLGFGFLAYEDQRSTVLAVDNFNGYKLLSRILRVDHANFRRPKGKNKDNDVATTADGNDPANPRSAPEDDEDYDRRRKQIWDYELYGTLDAIKKPTLGLGELPSFNDNGDADVQSSSSSSTSIASLPSDSKDDIKHADRIMQMLAKKRLERERGGGGDSEAQEHTNVMSNANKNESTNATRDATSSSSSLSSSSSSSSSHDNSSSQSDRPQSDRPHSRRSNDDRSSHHHRHRSRSPNASSSSSHPSSSSHSSSSRSHRSRSRDNRSSHQSRDERDDRQRR